jgi:hypothetical protein
MLMNVSAEQAREALRRKHGVRLVQPDEEGAAAVDLPVGLYGFTSSPALASPMFAARRYRNFEVHRLAAAPAVVGFVTAADAARLSSTSSEPVAIRVFPDAVEEVSTIVAISYDRIVQHRQYSIRNAEAIVLHVEPTGAELLNV